MYFIQELLINRQLRVVELLKGAFAALRPTYLNSSNLTPKVANLHATFVNIADSTPNFDTGVSPPTIFNFFLTRYRGNVVRVQKSNFATKPDHSLW